MMRPQTAGRRALGLFVLLLALLAVTIVPAMLGPGLDGIAVRAPLPEPPPVGSCLMGTDLVVVDCSEPHQMEVTKTWAAFDPDRPRSSDLDGECSGAAEAYVGIPVKEVWDWTWSRTLLNFKVTPTKAPLAQWVNGKPWSICTISPTAGGSYLGTVMSLRDSRDRPSAYGFCARFYAGAVYSSRPASCVEDHEAEILATGMDFIPDDPVLARVPRTFGLPLPPEASLRKECDRMASELLRRADPTVGGQLEVALEYFTEPIVSVGSDETSAITTVDGMMIHATCYLRATDGRILADSVIGLGNNPLPLR